MATIQFFDSKEAEWADMEVFIAGARVAKIRGMRFKPAQDQEPLHAAGNKPISIQSGNITYEGEIKLLKGAVDAMDKAALAAGGDSILDLEFDIVITFRPAGSRKLSTHTCVGVRVKEYERGFDQGAKFMEVTLPFSCLRIKTVS